MAARAQSSLTDHNALSRFFTSLGGRANLRKWMVAITLLAVLLTVTAGIALMAPATQTIPTISIISVDKDNSVTIRTHNYPANQTFVVRMGAMGSRGIGGVEVGELQSGAGGTLEATFAIPDQFKGARQIAIRLESAAGYYSFNWFWNNTAGNGDGTGGGTVYRGIPTFSIASVAKDQTVTITPRNFPPNRTFVVLMNWIGTRGIGGAEVTRVNTNASGELDNLTYAIPDQFKGARQVAIRLQATSGGYFAYNWFYNNTTNGDGTGDGTGGGDRYTGIPTFSIVSVQRDQSVTIKTNNLPPNRTFIVTMNYMGTRGIGGTQVATTDSLDGGSLTATYDIPQGLHGEYRIAIRMQATTGGYYAYNWFYNNTTQ